MKNLLKITLLGIGILNAQESTKQQILFKNWNLFSSTPKLFLAVNMKLKTEQDPHFTSHQKN